MKTVLVIALWTGMQVAALAANAEKREKTEPPAYLAVMPLRNVGGLSERGPDGQPMNVRFARAMQTYLSDMAEGRYAVMERLGQRPPRMRYALRFTLEGELSRVADGSPGGGPYQCAVRLFREEKRRLPVAQWAGTAATLRDLTANLNRAPNVDVSGLMGELGKRVIAAVTREIAAQHRQILAALPTVSPDSLRVTIFHKEGEGVPVLSSLTLEPGQDYRLKIEPSRPLRNLLLSIGEEGEIGPLCNLEEEVPTDTCLLTAETVTRPVEREFVVLRRRAPDTERIRRETANVFPSRLSFWFLVFGGTRTTRNQKPISSIAPSLSGRGLGVGASERSLIEPAGCLQRLAGNASETPPVQVIPEAADDKKALTIDKTVSALLQSIARDRPGTWEARWIKIRIVPKGEI